MEAGLRAFAERAGIEVRHDCRWESTAREGDRLVLGTPDGAYRCRAAVFAIGMTEPWVPSVPGLELEQHYVHVRAFGQRYRDRRVVIVGKRNSAFEVGEGILRQGLR